MAETITINPKNGESERTQIDQLVDQLVTTSIQSSFVEEEIENAADDK
jgi:hypothetical protein